MNVQERAVEFSRVAIALGELMTSVPFERNDRVDAAQWLIPIGGGREHAESSLGDPGEHYTPVIRAMARAINTHTGALAIIGAWNDKVTPNENALRYVAVFAAESYPH